MTAAADFKPSPIKGNELLIGCGNSRVKQMRSKEGGEEFTDLVTMDMSAACEPDVQWDLNHIPYPFEDNTFQEIHAYEVLEHYGTQGDWKAFFAHFSELWRILKPDGRIFATTPCWDSVWAWGDPGHTRIINEGTVSFLSQKTYSDAVGSSTTTDYREHYAADFEVEHCQEVNGRLTMVLKAIK